MARGDRPADAQDASRREFFRTFSRQTVQSAGSLMGAAAELRRTSLAAAREILDVGSGDPPAALETNVVGGATADWSFRSPYHFTGQDIVILDQRELPGRVTTVSVREPSEVASAIRLGAVNGGPVLAEVAAYAMVLAAASSLDRPPAGRQQLMGAAAGALRGARRDVRALGWAVDRLEARYGQQADRAAETHDLVDALRAEADDIAVAAAAAHAAIGRLGAQAVGASTTDGALNVLMHGDMGPLSCGLIGMGTALLQALADAGRDVQVWLTEAAPGLEGGRIASLQLTHNDVPHTVIPDTAVAWLLVNRHIDAVLLRGDRVCVNGDTGALIGSLSVAQLAAAAGVPVHVLAPLASFDPAAADGGAISVPLNTARRGGRLNPASDVVPAGLITSLVTEGAQ